MTNWIVPETLDWRMRQMNSNLPLEYSLSSAVAHGGGKYLEVGADNQRNPDLVDQFSDSGEDTNWNDEEEEQPTDEDSPSSKEDEDKENCIPNSINDSRISTPMSTPTNIIIARAVLTFTYTGRLAELAKTQCEKVNRKRKMESSSCSDNFAGLGRMARKQRTEFLGAYTEVTKPESIEELGPDLSDLPNAPDT
jgi:hypothetical protein